MYKVTALTGEISVDRYIEDFVNVSEFLELCKACPNYGRKWSCPPYDFEPVDYWKRFKTLRLLGSRIELSSDEKATAEQRTALAKRAMREEKARITEELFELEEQIPGSVSLSAGSCAFCGDEGCDKAECCTRSLIADGENVEIQEFQGKEGSADRLLAALGSKEGFSCDAMLYCRHRGKLRFSIEALGGNVGKTCTHVLGTELQWLREGQVPDYYTLVCGLLIP